MNRSVQPELPASSIDALWSTLIDDSGADVAIMNADGRVLWVKNPIAWWSTRTPDAEVAGKTLHELFSKEIADERIELIRRAMATGKPIVLYGIWRGVRTRTVIRPLPAMTGTEPRVLTICRGPVPTDRDRGFRADGGEIVQAKYVDPGQLGKLTPRELEILGMIAQGMTTAAIAKKLFRSRKTVEAHRLSMGAKLGVRNRVELARIALEAGLLSAATATLPTAQVVGANGAAGHDDDDDDEE